VKVKIRKLSKKAQLPKRHNKTDAAFDLFSTDEISISPGQTLPIHTNISMEIPQGYYGKIESRSSLALKGLFTTGGVIDSGYRGEILVILNNLNSKKEFQIKYGDRIAQIVFHRVELVELSSVNQLDELNNRGGGFGRSEIRFLPKKTYPHLRQLAGRTSILEPSLYLIVFRTLSKSSTTVFTETSNKSANSCKVILCSERNLIIFSRRVFIKIIFPVFYIMLSISQTDLI